MVWCGEAAWNRDQGTEKNIGGKNKTKLRFYSQSSLQALRMSSEESINLLIPEFISKLSTSPLQIIPNVISFLKKYLKEEEKKLHNWVFPNSHSKDCLP